MIVIIGYSILSVVLLFFSYGFVDKNLHLSTNWLYTSILDPLQYLVFEKRGWAGGIYVGLLLGFWLLFYVLLRKIDEKKINFDQLKKLIIITSTILLFSFPAFSYDIFNYILTARVTYTYQENPWIIRPIEIPNEPALAYTRAANKVALYGPTWILLTAIPHLLGGGNVWMSIIAFKLLVFGFYYFFLFLVWRITKSLWNVAFFAFNPLILITVLNEGHNDIVMMVLAVLGILALKKIWKTKLSMLTSVLFYIASVFIKFGTIVLLPLYFFRKQDLDRLWTIAYWLMFVVFLASPLREEMYPWYFVWCLTMVAFFPKSHRFLYGFSLALCFGLLLRNTPYIITRQYDGYNQIIRTAVTWIPLMLYGCYTLVNQKFRKFF